MDRRDEEDDLNADWLVRHSTPTSATGYVEAQRTIDYEKVVKVALNPDDELRNLQVALLYSLTSTRMDQRLLHGLHLSAGEKMPKSNANWFTIAQWAVLTVGRNMRSNDLPHRTSNLPSWARRRLTPAILNLRAADDRRVAAALSYGQIMVFASVYYALLKDSAFADHSELPVRAWRESDPDPEPIPGRPAPVRTDTTTDEENEAELGAEIAEELELEPEAAASNPPVTPIPDTAESSSSAPPFPIAGLREMVDSYLEDKARAEDEADAADMQQRKVVRTMAVKLGADPIYITPHFRGPRERFYEAVLFALAKRAGYLTEIRRAFELYRVAAVSCPERKAGSEDRSRADLIFEASLRIAAVEQVILDGAVTQVVDHLPRHVTQQAEGRLATYAERSLRVPRRIAQMNSSRRLAGAAAIAQDLWARVMTDQIMVVAFPAETVRLGRDIPFRDWTKPFFAEELEGLSEPALALFDQFDRSLGDGRGAGAGDWRRFDDRMNFVANLLRSRQQDASLFWAPFIESDVARLWRGEYPDRVGDPFEQAVRSPDFEDYDTASCDELSWDGQPFDFASNMYRGDR